MASMENYMENKVTDYFLARLFCTGVVVADPTRFGVPLAFAFTLAFALPLAFGFSAAAFFGTKGLKKIINRMAERNLGEIFERFFCV